MVFNPDIHHRHSIRLKDYDYSQNGAYFVTICAWSRECLFGDLVDGTMQLNEFGQVAADSWRWLSSHYSYVELDEWTVMPNHLHGIIVIHNHLGGSRTGGSRTAPTEIIKPLGGLIGAFKTVSTKQINILRNNPGCPLWQRDYYEHVIRNETELARIREYIVNNPSKWEFDKENPSRRGGSRTARS